MREQQRQEKHPRLIFWRIFEPLQRASQQRRIIRVVSLGFVAETLVIDAIPNVVQIRGVVAASLVEQVEQGVRDIQVVVCDVVEAAGSPRCKSRLQVINLEVTILADAEFCGIFCEQVAPRGKIGNVVSSILQGAKDVLLIRLEQVVEGPVAADMRVLARKLQIAELTRSITTRRKGSFAYHGASRLRAD